MHITQTHVAKLFGTNNNHLWLEGQRLADAGFRTGDPVHAIWYKDSLVLSKGPYVDVNQMPVKTGTRNVVKSGNHPAIRIEGQLIADTFGKYGDKVHVEFNIGLIKITRMHPGDVPAASIPVGVETQRESVSA